MDRKMDGNMNEWMDEWINGKYCIIALVNRLNKLINSWMSKMQMHEWMMKIS